MIAMTTSFFHWGLSAWAISARLTIPLAHACFTEGLPFRFSSPFYYVFGDQIPGTLGKIIDVFAVFATLGGLATTTGPVALHLSSGLQFQYGISLPAYASYLIMGVLAVALLFLIATLFLSSGNSAVLALAMFVSGKEDPAATFVRSGASLWVLLRPY